MFSVSKQVDYGLQFLLALAVLPEGEWLSVKTFADQRTISFLFLQKIVRKLKQAGLIVAAKGANGGYQLALDPEELTLKCIVEAIEGSYATAACMKGEQCPIEDQCSSKDIISFVQRDVIASLEKYTLIDMSRF